MMGERRVIQEALFYDFSLERHAPADHMLGLIDRFVDLFGIRARPRPFYSEIDRMRLFLTQINGSLFLL
jgi:hypothetical protein